MFILNTCYSEILYTYVCSFSLLSHSIFLFCFLLLVIQEVQENCPNTLPLDPVYICAT